MRGILADLNLEGHFDTLAAILQGEDWRDLWTDLDVKLYRFRELTLARTASDAEVWHECQRLQLVLMTANRNEDSPDSLEATLRQHNTVESLPVFTVGNARRILRSRDYAERVAEKLIDLVMRIEDLRGTGRLYLP